MSLRSLAASFMVLITFGCTTWSQSTPEAQSSAAPHAKAFWQSIIHNDCNPPAGENVGTLARELSEYLGSPDPELRDEIAYTILTSWIYEKKLLSNDQSNGLRQQWIGNLQHNVGAVGTDDVLRRSFSALMLSVMMAADNKASLFSEQQFRETLTAAIEYSRRERDLRGFDQTKGWIHATAHTADLLKFVGRNRFVSNQDQAAILDAVADKMRGADTVFIYGEDERLARTVLSIVNRKDFNCGGFTSWASQMKPKAPTASVPSYKELAQYQNVKNLLSKLYVVLALSEGEAQREQRSCATKQVAAAISGTF